jgi:hypothetical protein
MTKQLGQGDGGQGSRWSSPAPCPDGPMTKFLEWQKIGILWFEQKNLKTSTSWLKHLAID